ncbi:uncharacterized protein TNCV_2750521 [Trichonephila clavipes]|nr:uncharacterized protein TNCV_2750521 [Trichonephila clavipes]
MSSKTNKGVAWLYNEVCALLDIWADQEIQQQLAGRLHNMCIYEKISKRLADLGIHRTGEQCREKIKKLRRDYKTVVDNNYSPAFARKMLVCYDKVHEIFGKCAVLKPSFVIESIIYNENILNNGNQILTDKHSDIIKDDNSNLQLNKHLDMHGKKHSKDSLNCIQEIAQYNAINDKDYELLSHINPLEFIALDIKLDLTLNVRKNDLCPTALCAIALETINTHYPPDGVASYPHR